MPRTRAASTGWAPTAVHTGLAVEPSRTRWQATARRWRCSPARRRLLRAGERWALVRRVMIFIHFSVVRHAVVPDLNSHSSDAMGEGGVSVRDGAPGMRRCRPTHRGTRVETRHGRVDGVADVVVGCVGLVRRDLAQTPLETISRNPSRSAANRPETPKVGIHLVGPRPPQPDRLLGQPVSSAT
jgi:hypothetical protein